MIRCVLDEHGCIDLLAVMRIMNQVDQEQVWAIAYELAAQMQRLWPAGNCALIENLAQIHLHQDGFVHEKSLLKLGTPSSSPELRVGGEQRRVVDNTRDSEHPQEVIPPTSQQQQWEDTAKIHQTGKLVDPEGGQSREDPLKMQTANTKTTSDSKSQLPPSPPITPELTSTTQTSRQTEPSESELVSSLGIALFQILDYGIPDDEERKLSMTMEYLIYKSQSELKLDEILEICIKRLDVATKTNADNHYRGVCKSLVDDTLELSIFLERIYTATMELSPGSLTATTTTRPPNSAAPTTSHGDLMNGCCLVAAAAAAKRHNKSLTSEKDGKLNSCDALNLLGQHHHIDYHHLTSHVVNRDHINELGLPLASLRALKIDDWARLWMQVIKEMRQRSEFKHLGMTTAEAAAGQELGCSQL